MRVVIDTNIWISGLLWQGLPWQLLRLAEQGRVELCLSYPMLQELSEVLAYPKLTPRLEKLGISLAELEAFVMSLAHFFDAPGSDEIIVAADPDDDMILHCAISADAAFVVSGDRHLLDLGKYGDIPIVSINEFFALEFPEHQ